MDLSCCLCFVFVFAIMSCLFFVAFWSLAVKGQTSWLSCNLCFPVFLPLSHRCSGTGVVLDCIDS